MSQLTKHLRADEKVLWSGKPVKVPFVLPHSLFTILPGLFFIGFSIFWMSMTLQSGAPWFFPLFGLLFFFIGLAVSFGEPIRLLMAYRNTEYMITDQRVIIQTGAIGLDTRFVDLDKIQEVLVNVGFIDQMFGTGTVRVPTAGLSFDVSYDSEGHRHVRDLRPSLAALKEPYEVQKLLQEALEKARTAQTR